VYGVDLASAGGGGSTDVVDGIDRGCSADDVVYSVDLDVDGGCCSAAVDVVYGDDVVYKVDGVVAGGGCSTATDAVYGTDRCGSSVAVVDCSTSDRSFIANLGAAAGDVILVRGAESTSPRRAADRERADMTLS